MSPGHHTYDLIRFALQQVAAELEALPPFGSLTSLAWRMHEPWQPPAAAADSDAIVADRHDYAGDQLDLLAALFTAAKVC